MLELIWLIPLLPLVGVVVNGFFGRRMSLRAVGTLVQKQYSSGMQSTPMTLARARLAAQQASAGSAP